MPIRGHIRSWIFQGNDAANLGDSLAPTLSTIEVGAVADNKIVLTYDELLDTTSVPATGDFAMVGSGSSTISSVAVSGATVTLTLSVDIFDFEIITLSYTAGTNPIRDLAENNAANLTSEAVTNNGNASCTLNAATLDYTDLSLSSAQVDAHIAGVATCTNSTIDLSGTNSHRTASSNDDLNTGLANGNIYTLNDVLGAELHTDANAASDPNGNEADATTGWVALNNAVVSSVSSPVNVGSYAIEIESNTTPTQLARIDLSFTVETASVYRLEFDYRHIGTGFTWTISPNFGPAIVITTNSDLTYQKKVYYFTAPDTSTNIRIGEANASNNGGVYMDNLSLKKVTLT